MIVYLFQNQIVVIFLVVFGSSYCQTKYVEKYITNTYFKNYDSLINSEFNKFIANEIPLSLCIPRGSGNCVIPKLSVLRRNIIGEGSHRRLSSSIIFNLQPETNLNSTTHSCKLVVIESLPTGVFADPFELQHLIQRKVFSDAAVFGDTNLELPSFRSNQSVVEIHMSISAKELQRFVEGLEVNLEVPLHARYQPLGHGYSRVEFGQPDWIMCCSPQGNVDESSCALMSTDYILDKKATPVMWEIPCGIKEHARVVSVVTFGFAVVTALLIILVSICYS